MNIRIYLAYILIATLIAPPILYKIGFDHALHKAKREARMKFVEGVSTQELIHLRISKHEEKEISWKHSREFRFRGKMYDILSVEHRDDCIIYTVWEDTRENKLYIRFHQFLNSFAGGQPLEKGNATLFQLLIKSFYRFESAVRVLSPFHLLSTVYYRMQVSKVCPGFLTGVLAPPELMH